jgi:hypothetical protein
MMADARPVRAAAAAGALALLAAAHLSARPKADAPDPGGGPYVVDPASIMPPYQISGRAGEITIKGVRVRVEPLDDARRATYFQVRTRIGVDPFPTRSIYPPGFNVFAVSIQNGSGKDLSFTPALANCRDDRERDVRLLSEDDLFDRFRSIYAGEMNPEKSAIAALAAFHVGPLLLEHGQSVTKLIVAEATKPNAQRLTLFLDEMQVGPEELRLRFPFVSVTASEGRR